MFDFPITKSDILALCLLLSGTVLLVLTGLRSGDASRYFATNPAAAETPLGLSTLAGEEIRLVVLVSEQCGASNWEGLPGAVSRVEDQLRDRLSGIEESHLVTVGVALSWEVSSGLAFLERFPGLDEVSAGRSWANDAAISYFWRDIPAEAAIPQLLVLRRRIEQEGPTLLVGTDELLGRAVGLEEIQRWSDGAVRLMSF